MKSLYNKVFKNNQVIYGRPYQAKIPVHTPNITFIEEEQEVSEFQEEDLQKPEDLLEKAKKESELILKEAEFEADRLIEEAKKKALSEAGDISEEAWQKGYAEGMEAARSQNEAMLAEAENIRQSAEEEHESIIAGLENEIIELVLKIARKAVAGELLTNREIIKQLIADTLMECSNKNSVVIKVSPFDYEFLTENRDEILSGMEGAELLEIKKDISRKPGDLVMETAFGSVDAGVDTRLNKIEEAFREMLGGGA